MYQVHAPRLLGPFNLPHLRRPGVTSPAISPTISHHLPQRCSPPCPRLLTRVLTPRPSSPTAVPFPRQTKSLSGGPNPKGHAPVDFLFGGGCGGGLIFRPGVNKVRCGNPQDCGGYCHEMCPETDETTDAHSLTCPVAGFSWAPNDIHLYLKQETLTRRGGAYVIPTEDGPSSYKPRVVMAPPPTNPVSAAP